MIFVRKATVPVEITIGAHLRSMGNDARIILPYSTVRHRTATELPELEIKPCQPMIMLMAPAETPAPDAS